MVTARANGSALNHCLEAAKKTLICLGAAIGISYALPYSPGFAFEMVTYLGFAVAFTEGAISVLADWMDSPDYAVSKIFEGVQSLGAATILALATLCIGY
ncbi:MAG TPA: hypothetical protein VF342_12925 [Alphaproteobacteria bacterium]